MDGGVEQVTLEDGTLCKKNEHTGRSRPLLKERFEGNSLNPVSPESRFR